MRSVLLLLLIPTLVAAQVPLAESIAPGTIIRNEIVLSLSGAMKFDRNNRVESVTIVASGKHVYVERNETSTRSLRHYFEASSATTVGIERGQRTLDQKHRLIAVNRTSDGPLHCSASGPMTRDDLSLVAEHFDAMLVPGLLPGKAVAVGDSWPIRDDTVTALCLFDGLVMQTLKGKLIEADATHATFTVEGTAEGIEHGAKVKLSIAARGEFEITAKRIAKLTWEQADQREQGPVSPAMDAKVKLTLTRTIPSEEPKELSAAIRELAAAKNGQETLTQVRYSHPEGKYNLLHDRDWHAVVQTESHLVLRLVVRGELIAQATITPWKQANPAVMREDSTKEFLDSIAKQPGWEPAKVISSEAVPTQGTHSIYRHVATGKQDGIEVVQSFQRIVNADGRQVIVTCVVKPELLEKMAKRDAVLANAIDFPAMK